RRQPRVLLVVPPGACRQHARLRRRRPQRDRSRAGRRAGARPPPRRAPPPRHGMGPVLDFVPNHMGIARADNPWWLAVLEWGPASPAAEWFDIDWRPAKREVHGKVLLPFLGDHYGRVITRGELRPAFDPDAGAL